MFKMMRREDRKVSLEESKVILKKGEYGILNTIGEDGYPYGVPVSYVYMDGNIYFHCATVGTKLDNISRESKVSFTVVGDTEVLGDKFTTNYESVISFGAAKEVFEEEKIKALFKILEKYSPEYLEMGKIYLEKMEMKTKVIKINIEHMSGKRRG